MSLLHLANPGNILTREIVCSSCCCWYFFFGGGGGGGRKNRKSRFLLKKKNNKTQKSLRTFLAPALLHKSEIVIFGWLILDA